jgi:PAS domain S-box-containing protein
MISSQDLPPLLHDHPLPTWSYDSKTLRVLASNKAANRLFGYTSSAWKKLTLKDFIALPYPYKINKELTGNAITRSGSSFPVKGYFKSIKEKKKQYDLLILHEYQGELAEKNDLAEKHSRLDKIVRVSHNEIYLVNDRTLAFEYANTAALKNLGYTPDELQKLKLTALFGFPDEMALQALLNSLRRAETDRLQLQLKYTRKDGSHYDADVLIQVLEKDKLFLILVTDITDKLITEKKLLDTIYEKETLIKEIHHRVKNNLQLISSIIYLKQASQAQPDIRAFLEDTRQKIRSIALIHERLLQTEKLDKVEISDYLGKLIHDLEVTYYRPDLALEIKTGIAENMVSLDTAIICGLIVNELVTNAIKHAFRGSASGLLRIQFDHDQKQKKFRLIVSDNGISLPEHITPGNSNSFGMQLIDVFVKQLGGTIEIIREKGTTFQIVF